MRLQTGRSPVAPATETSGCFFAFVRIVAVVGEAEGGGWSIAWVLREGLITVRALLAAIAILLAVLELRLAGLMGLRGHQDPIIMFGVLQIIFCLNAIARRIRVPRELQIFLVNMRGRTANLHVRTGAVERPVVIILRPAAASA